MHTKTKAHQRTITVFRPRLSRSTDSGLRRHPLRFVVIASWVALCIATVVTGDRAVATTTVTDRALLTGVSTRVVVLPPGKATTVWFDFTNIGTSTWTNAGTHPVSLNTDNRMLRKSKFAIPQWRAYWRPTRLVQKTVRPGQVGRVRFGIKAPNMPGTWRESFALVKDNNTRIPGGNVELIIVVKGQPVTDTIYHASPNKAQYSFWVQPGGQILQSLSFKNTGKATLRNEGWGTVTLSHDGPGYVTPASGIVAAAPVPGAILQPARQNETTSATIAMTAPTVLGTFTDTFTLVGPYGPIAGSTVTVTTTVSSDPQPPLAAEPSVRVGVFSPSFSGNTLAKASIIGATGGPFEARAADTNSVLASYTADQTATVQFDKSTSKYTVTKADGTKVVTASVVRFTPTADATILQINNSSLGSYNRFRGVLEAHYSPTTGKLWVIDELPVEQYLKGLGETGSTSPVEFAKALITAARTYALYKVYAGTSHNAEFFDISADTDQVYHGYAYELLTANITQAVTATRGVVITHPSMIRDFNKLGIIIAAYSSCTDGRTRSYTERWGGTPNQFPYLVSVPDPLGICTNPPYSNAATLLQGGNGNHMVGMSAYGALQTIKQQNATYDAVLKYYYSGVTLLKAYL